MKHIQEEAAKKEKESAQYFTDRCNKISQREHERLNVILDNRTGQLLSEPVCSYRYYSQLMQNYRNGIKALGFKHHVIKRHINIFLRKYSNKKEGLHKKLDPHLPIEKLRENIILLRTNTVTGSDFRRDLLRL
ncbi:hypothetical protein [Candidatus Williamhamiltonella defendens]|uniref:hypothetical protein n=1 Tax=Candidatus Williamhamiltonella defendens TaxID=138072 RepID=UPI001F407D0C|nr:hypothetical protein [Candidatus Hamiltonella defensa]